MKRRNGCEVCGKLFPIYHMVWLSSMMRGQPNHKAPRWPYRRALMLECCECGWLTTVVQELSGRGATQTEFA